MTNARPIESETVMRDALFAHTLRARYGLQTMCEADGLANATIPERV